MQISTEVKEELRSAIKGRIFAVATLALLIPIITSKQDGSSNGKESFEAIEKRVDEHSEKLLQLIEGVAATDFQSPTQKEVA